MQKQYHVSGRYLARYPNGHYTGKIGISTQVLAKNKREAKKSAIRKAMEINGYVQCNWLDVQAYKI